MLITLGITIVDIYRSMYNIIVFEGYSQEF